MPHHSGCPADAPCAAPQDLREECLKLRTRVFDLEQQNRALGVLFQQRIKPASDLLLQVRWPLRARHPRPTTHNHTAEARAFKAGLLSNYSGDKGGKQP